MKHWDDSRIGVGPTIVIDLSFGDLMRPQEVTSMSNQTIRCYASNRRAEAPLRLLMVGPKDAESTLHRMDSVFSVGIRPDGSGSWAKGMHAPNSTGVVPTPSCNGSYFVYADDVFGTDLFAPHEVVYLSAEAEDELDVLDPETVYVVGGFVDRNRYKGLTAAKAAHHNVRTARLPIGDFIASDARKVITVNQVVEILINYHGLRSWERAVREVIPLRRTVPTSAGARPPTIPATS